MMPDKIYIHRTHHLGLLSASEIDITGQDEQYIRKDYVDEMVKSAEDHAYFAGQEKLREKLLEWAKEHKERLEAIFDAMPSSVVAGKLQAYKEVIENIESL